jgi:hypothetical protein
MSTYEGQTGSEFGEVGEFGEFGEVGEFGELGEGGEFESEVGEFGEVGEGPEAHEQFLGDILGSVMGGEIGSPLNEAQEVELASELLGVTNEQELEQFLGGLFSKVARGVSNFAKSSAGRALGGVLKGIAKKALPVVGGALGSMVAPGIGTALGSKLGSMASGLFEFEFEALPAEQAEFEVARRYVRLASTAARQLAMARPRPGLVPLKIARAAVARAARTEAPGLYRQMIRTLVAGGTPAHQGMRHQAFRPGAPLARPLRAQPGHRHHHRGYYPGSYSTPGSYATGVYTPGGYTPNGYTPPGYTPTGGTDPISTPTATTPTPGYASTSFAPTAGVADGWPESVADHGMAQSGRWVRRGRKIILVGV